MSKEPDPYSLPDACACWKINDAWILCDTHRHASPPGGVAGYAGRPPDACPNCSAPLLEQHCKLRCSRPCGYFVSCSE